MVICRLTEIFSLSDNTTHTVAKLPGCYWTLWQVEPRIHPSKLKRKPSKRQTKICFKTVQEDQEIDSQDSIWSNPKRSKMSRRSISRDIIQPFTILDWLMMVDLFINIIRGGHMQVEWRSWSLFTNVFFIYNPVINLCACVWKIKDKYVLCFIL